MSKQKFLLLSFLFWQLLMSAQEPEKSVITQDIVWLRYHNILSINERWLLNTEIDVRRFVFPDRAHQWVLPRLHAHYKLNNALNVGGGAVLFLQALPQEQESDVLYTRPEIRPHQEINFKQFFGKLSISHRVRVEERFFLKTDFDQPEFNFRFRYQLLASFPLVAKENYPSLHLKVADEVMFNAGSNVVNNIFDQNRIYAALQLTRSKNWSTEVGYMNWYQQRPSGTDFFNRNILRITVTHTVKLKK